MKRTKYPKIYVVGVEGIDDYFFISSREHKRKPYLMTLRRASKLLARLNKKFHGKFYKKLWN